MEVLSTISVVELLVVVGVDATWVGVLHKSINDSALTLLMLEHVTLRAAS
jgi:hypothetical protein